MEMSRQFFVEFKERLKIELMGVIGRMEACE